MKYINLKFYNLFYLLFRFKGVILIGSSLLLISFITIYYFLIQLFIISQNDLIFILAIAVLLFGLFVISVLVFFQINKLIVDRKKNNAGSQLHWRMAILFGGVSIIPSIILAGFGLFIVDYSFRGWFSDRISTAVNASVKVAEGYLDEHKRGVRGSILAMVNDINREAPKLVLNPEALDNYLSTQAVVRNLSEAMLINSSKMILGRSQFGFSIALSDLNEDVFEKAKIGDLVFLRTDYNNKIRGLVKINRLVDVYLYAGRFVEPSVLDAIDRTKLAFNQYQSINIASTNLQVSFGLLFFLFALLLSSTALWIGLKLANSIIEPLSAVIRVANIARLGNLEARVKNNLGIEEISKLGSSFNKMLDEISRSRKELIIANLQLNKRREFTEAILLGVSSGVIGLDTDCNINLPNKRAIELLKLPVNSCYGKNFIELVPEFSNLVKKVKYTSLKNYEEQIVIQFKLEKRTFLSRISVELVDGNISGYVITFDDVTELLSAQKKAAWSDIAQRIAHEIRNPLTPIQLAVERLKNKYKPKDFKDLTLFNGYVETIQRQVDDIGKLVEEFSSFAKMPSANLSLMNLEKVINTQYSLFKMSNSKIKWKYISSNYSKDIILIDPHQIRQALTNLFQNAVDIINENLTIGKGEIIIHTEGNENSIFLVVEDNGPGFPKERDALINPYVTFRKKGTGLGLSIVQRIMEEHNGKLILDDNNSGGAKVLLEFPKL